MSVYKNELMIDDGRNLPVAPFRFKTKGEFLTYKQLCEQHLHGYYYGANPLPLPESIALSVLRANIKKRYEHQLKVEDIIDDEEYPQLMENGLWIAQNEIVMPGESIKTPLDLFMGSSMASIETGFRFVAGQHTDAFDTRQTELNALLLASEYEADAEINPSRMLKVTRIIKDSTTDEHYAVVKTKMRGFMVQGDTAVESVGRRTGVMPMRMLGNAGCRAAKILARVGDSVHLPDDIRNDNKQILVDALAQNDETYIPAFERYYFARREHEDK